MAIKMKAVSAEAAARHPGCPGIESHAFADKETKTMIRCDWLWPLKAIVKLFLFVVLLFALPSLISFFIILFTASYYVNKLHRYYGRERRFRGHGAISSGSGSASGLSSSGTYQARLVSVVGAELIPDNPDFISDSSSSHWCGDINPASGLPMIEDSCIDVGGNVFGGDNIISIDIGFECGISSDQFDSIV
ncbi:hypothetical protein ABN057_16145 [Providencia alcalifaciens]|uniref:hypothetical protein n=1 Tax=Providencia TaxID=586 RepID=UPI00197FC833|nr:hypothetical protein [Providencia rettgeri]MBN6351779.1 hypothetical protein [Providencia rettgeri]HEM6923967.1 hypothetical protein [Providencia rettgeri]